MAKEIELSQGHVAIVDDDDYEWISSMAWHYSNGYAVHSERIDKDLIERWYMHRLIMGVTDPALEVGHINLDRLDNRRSNLKIGRRMKNARLVRIKNGRGGNGGYWAGNKYGYRGVKFIPKGKKQWSAQISIKGERTHLGVFSSVDEAARAYDDAARLRYGDLAITNFAKDES